MKHPKSADVLKVVKNFESILHLATTKDHLNMSTGCVNVSYKSTIGDKEYYQCGTIHCHGGWYAIACELHKTGIVDYSAGVEQMAKDLGFGGNREQLENWAHENPKIWGNEFGDRMFCGNILDGYMAFYHETKRPYGAVILKDIIDHWKEIAERLQKMENKIKNKKSPTYKNITKELAILSIEETPDKIQIRDKIKV